MLRSYRVLTAATFLGCLMAPSFSQAAGNPASMFCEEMGGRSVGAKLASGNAIGLCYLPGEKIVEEWTLFHMFDGNVPADEENPFL